MKTITIPTCANPFVVIVNGIKYTYPAGATVEVPDDVAEVIEQHEEAKPEPAPVLPPFAPVPSEGGDGLEVVELTTTVIPHTNSYFNEAESAALTSAWQKGKPIIIKCPFDAGTLVVDDFSVVAMYGLAKMEGKELPVFAFSFGSYVIQFVDITVLGYNGWSTSTNTI